jgi:hypothetical protein
MVTRRPTACGLLLLLASGCAPIAAPVDVEVMRPIGLGNSDYELATATLHQVTDLFAGRGEDFDVRAGFNLNMGSVLGELRDEQLSFDELVERSRRDDGSDPAPRLSWDGARWVAEDFESLHYTTLVHNLERAWRFARDDVGDVSGATGEPSLIGQYATLSLLDALPIPLQTSDNAAYVSFSDSWMTFRSVLTVEGIPFAMNPGVIGHEFHHRVFYRNVFSEDAYDIWLAWISSEELSRSSNLIRALDEGLADVFAVALTGDPSFMAPSLPSIFEAEAAYRDLEGAFAGSVTYDGLSQQTLNSDDQRRCGFTRNEGEDLFSSSAFKIYCGGTVIAAALWDASGSDATVFSEDIAPAVNRALPRMSQRIIAASVGDELTFDMDDFLDPLVEEIPAALRAETCSALEWRYQSLFDAGRVPACD